MSIYVTGDCHGDWIRFSPEIFPEQKNMTYDDYVIITGDFGLWHDTPEERRRLAALNDRPFTTLFIDGNHENFDRLNSGEFAEVDFAGGRADRIREHIYHLKRGYIFTLQGYSFFAFGGARSHDIEDGILDPDGFKTPEEFAQAQQAWTLAGRRFRVNHRSWWKEEMPSEEEMTFAKRNLAEHGNKVDFILTHCGPWRALWNYAPDTALPDRLTAFLEEIGCEVDFVRWFFGHYHDNKAIMTKYLLLYEQIIRVV